MVQLGRYRRTPRHIWLRAGNLVQPRSQSLLIDSEGPGKLTVGAQRCHCFHLSVGLGIPGVWGEIRPQEARSIYRNKRTQFNSKSKLESLTSFLKQEGLTFVILKCSHGIV